MKTLYILLCTIGFTALGFYLGHKLHDEIVRIAIATCAGAAGGLGIGCAGSQVFSLWQSENHRA